MFTDGGDDVNDGNLMMKINQCHYFVKNLSIWGYNYLFHCIVHKIFLTSYFANQVDESNKNSNNY